MMLGFDPTLNLLVLVLVLAWLAVLSFLLLTFYRRYRLLTRNVTESNLQDIWVSYLKLLETNSRSIEEIKSTLRSMEEADRRHLQRVGLVRFNPFSDTGSNQSFSLAVLDAKGDGVALSCLYSREGTRLYGKGVKGFAGAGFELSQEEKEAIEYARKS